jgi:hypothetical protein
MKCVEEPQEASCLASNSFLLPKICAQNQEELNLNCGLPTMAQPASRTNLV